MSNQVYLANKVVYDDFLALLVNKVTEAETTADFSTAETYSGIVKLIKNWINTDGYQPDPSDEKIWLDLGLKKPEPSPEEPVEPQNNVVAELKVLSDRARDLLTKAPDKALIDVDNQIRDLIANNDYIQGDLKDKTLALLGDIEEKRKQVASALLDTIRETEDDEAFQKLLDDLKQWNPSDQKIAEAIADLETNRSSALSTDRITELFNYLTDKVNIDRFSSSLRYLEGIYSRGTIKLTTEEKKMIIASREWLDDYNQKMGVMSSVISFKNLRDTYIEFRKVRDYYNFETYMIKGEAKSRADAILELGRSWELASADEAQKQLDHAKQFFKDSPSRAVNHLKQVLDETEIYTFTTSDNNKIEETIKKRPFQEREQQIIRERIEEYNLYVEKEKAALRLVLQADAETDIYEKVSLYLNSRKFYYLPDVAEKIHIYLEAAKKTRLDDIRRELDDVELRIDRLEKLKLDKAKEDISSIRESINRIRKKILEPWLGVPTGADFLDSEEKKLITKPSELDNFEAEINELLKAVSQKEQLIDDLSSSIKEIERLLDSGETSEAINNYMLISQTTNFNSFSAFIEISQRIAKFRSFDEVVETIKRLFEINDFQGVVEYFYGIRNASSFTSGDTESKNEITKIVKESRRKYYLSRLKRYMDNRNIRAAKWILDTLKEMDFSDESVDLANEEIEQIIQGAQQLTEMFSSSYSRLGIKHPSPLTTIFSLIDRYREQINEASLNERDTDEFRSITDNSGNYVEEQKVSAVFEKIIDKHDFKQLYSLARTICYVSGNATENDSSWPRYQESIDTYDAKRIWPIIKSIVKKKISSYCEDVDAKKKEEDPSIGDLVLIAYHQLDLRGEKEFNKCVEDFAVAKAFRYTKDEKTISGLQSATNLFNYWNELAEIFPQNKVIQNECIKIKTEYVSSKLRSLLRGKQWEKAQALLQEHKDLIERNASLLKMRISYYLHEENPNFSIESAESDLEQLSDITKNDKETDELKVKLDVVRIKTKSNITELEVLEGVDKLRQSYTTRKDVIEKEFNTLFINFVQDHTRKYKDFLEKDNFIDAVLQVVSISRAEQINGNDFSRSQALIDNDTLKRNIPRVSKKLYTTARKINFLDDAEIDFKSKALEVLLSQLKGISVMIRVRYSPEDFNLPIHQIIGIESRDDSEDNPVTLADIEKSINLCNQKLNEINLIKDALASGGISEIWEESAKRIIDGNDRGWSAEIQTTQQAIEELSTKYSFRETTKFLTAFSQWSTSLKRLNQDYRSLRERIREENFKECVIVIKSIEECIDGLKDYSAENNATIKESLKSYISIPIGTNFLRGLSSISSYLETCLKQIDNLSTRELRLSERIESQKLEISAFLSNFDSFTKLLEKGELNEIRSYQESLQNLKDLIGEPEADQGPAIIPGINNMNAAREMAEEPIRERRSGFVARLFGRGRNNNHNAGNPLTHSLNRDFSNKAIESQVIQLKRILSSLDTGDINIYKETILSGQAAALLEHINQQINTIELMKSGIEQCVKNCDEILGVHVKLSPEKAQELIRKNNFITLAVEIKRSDPYFVMDDLKDFRNIALNHLA